MIEPAARNRPKNHNHQRVIPLEVQRFLATFAIAGSLVSGAAYGINKGLEAIQGKPGLHQIHPSKENPDKDFFKYDVLPGDSLSEIVNVGRSDLEPYGDEFNLAVDGLRVQLAPQSQLRGEIRNGATTLELDPDVYDIDAIKKWIQDRENSVK